MDRDYWRSEPTKRLIEEARTKGCELCVALGERLEEADDEISEQADRWENIAIDNDREITRLHTRLEELHEELAKRDDTISRHEERIEELEEQLNEETKK